jgi:hypothetical protein
MIAAVVAQLQANAPLLTSIEVAEDIEAIAEGTHAATGTAFVVPYRERAKPNSLATGGHRQLIDVQIVVAFLIRDHSDPKGAARAVQFDAFKNDIEQALAGWIADGAAGPFALVGGESSSMGNGVSIYAQTWETTRFLTGA